MSHRTWIEFVPSRLDRTEKSTAPDRQSTLPAPRLGPQTTPIRVPGKPFEQWKYVTIASKQPVRMIGFSADFVRQPTEEYEIPASPGRVRSPSEYWWWRVDAQGSLQKETMHRMPGVPHTACP